MFIEEIIVIPAVYLDPGKTDQDPGGPNGANYLGYYSDWIILSSRETDIDIIV